SKFISAAARSIASRSSSITVMSEITLKYSTGCHDGMLKSHIVEKPLDRGALRIGAARCNVPIAVGMRLRVADDHLAKRPPPCLRSAASLPDQAGDKQLLEVGCCHAHRIAALGGQASRRSCQLDESIAGPADQS